MGIVKVVTDLSHEREAASNWELAAKQGYTIASLVVGKRIKVFVSDIEGEFHNDKEIDVTGFWTEPGGMGSHFFMMENSEGEQFVLQGEEIEILGVE